MNPIPEIIHQYRVKISKNGMPLSFQRFAVELSQPLHIISRDISPSTISNWEHDKSPPNDTDLHALRLFAKPFSWQWLFASDLNAAKYPGIHYPNGPIGKKVLGYKSTKV